MSDAPRRCRDCGREKPAPVIPLDAGPLLRSLIEGCSNICRWCQDVKLLAGTGDEGWLIGDWDAFELADLRAEADKLRAHLQLEWRERKAERERERNEKVQGTLLAGPSAQREADAA